MRNTIKAKDGYHILKPRKDSELMGLASFMFDETDEDNIRIVADGDNIVMFALICPLDMYEMNEQCNECFHRCEVFTTRKGNQYVYWRDEETDTDYITRIPC